MCLVSQNQIFWTCSGTAKTLAMLHLLGNYKISNRNVLHWYFSWEQKFRSCRIRRRKSLHFDSSSEELSNILGDDNDINEAAMLNTKRLHVKDIYLLEPPPDYEVRSLVMFFVFSTNMEKCFCIVPLFAGQSRCSSIKSAEQSKHRDLLKSFCQWQNYFC
jgi:hypothetical protein